MIELDNYLIVLEMKHAIQNAMGMLRRGFIRERT